MFGYIGRNLYLQSQKLYNLSNLESTVCVLLDGAPGGNPDDCFYGRGISVCTCTVSARFVHEINIKIEDTWAYLSKYSPASSQYFFCI